MNALNAGPNNHQRGVTLIELLIGLTILVFFMILGFMGLSSLTNSFTSASNQLDVQNQIRDLNHSIISNIQKEKNAILSLSSNTIVIDGRTCTQQALADSKDNMLLIYGNYSILYDMEKDRVATVKKMTSATTEILYEPTLNTNKAYVTDIQICLSNDTAQVNNTFRNISSNLLLTVSMSSGYTKTLSTKLTNIVWREALSGQSAFHDLNGDSTAPSAPTGVQSSAPNSTTSITLSWSAATDNTAVTAYQVYRDGQLTGTTQTATYIDSGLAAGSSYVYTVKALDAANNSSGFSLSHTASTASGLVTVYFRKDSFTTKYMHYNNGKNWTVAPGTQMVASEVTGYSKLTVSLLTGTTLTADFTNGAGSWENSSGDYTFGAGTWSLYNNVKTEGIPSTPTPTPTPTPIPTPTPTATPIPSVNMAFQVNYNTKADGDIYIRYQVNGSTTDSKMTWTSGNNWRFERSLQTGSSFVYKYYYKNTQNVMAWETFSGDRTFTVPATGTTETDSWNVK